SQEKPAMTKEISKETEQESQDYFVILQEAYGGLEKEENRVITNNKELHEAYGIINRFRRPGLPVPEIDFEKYNVVAIFLGERSSGGYSAEISSISSVKNDLVINVKENRPNPDENQVTAICQPFCFVKIPKPDSKQAIVFRKN
ncbi:MAG: protease complex subunit PrcB family protein, partial [Bacteroidia bacterium]|nr:protease complex subunit PrcB family protein [Bacteroidia bacterium]